MRVLTLLTSTITSCSMWSITTDKNQRITLFINPSIIKHARAQAVVEELTLTRLVEQALIKYLPEKTVIKKIEIKERRWQYMSLSVANLSPLMSLVFGILILVFPKFLNYLIAGYLILVGVMGLGIIK
jgi:hypothetical protein